MAVANPIQTKQDVLSLNSRRVILSTNASHRCDKAIATTGYSCDVSRPVAAITNHPSQVGNLYPKGAVPYEHIWPYDLE